MAVMPISLALQGRAALPDTEMQALLDSGTISQGDSYVNSIASTQDMLVSVIVPLSFPLLLFSLNIKRWLRFAREGFISMILALISVSNNCIIRIFYFQECCS